MTWPLVQWFDGRHITLSTTCASGFIFFKEHFACGELCQTLAGRQESWRILAMTFKENNRKMCKVIFKKVFVFSVLAVISFTLLGVGCGKRQEEKGQKSPDMSEFERLEEITSPKEPEPPKPKLKPQKIVYEKSYLEGFVTYMRAKREPDKKGRPAPNSTVYIYTAFVEEDEQGKQTYKEGAFVKDIVTGADGSYKMELDPGTYVVVAYDEKARSSGPVFLEIKEGETKKQDIQLPGF